MRFTKTQINKTINLIKQKHKLRREIADLDRQLDKYRTAFISQSKSMLEGDTHFLLKNVITLPTVDLEKLKANKKDAKKYLTYAESNRIRIKKI